MCLKECKSPRMVCSNLECQRRLCICQDNGFCRIDGHYVYLGAPFCVECFHSLPRSSVVELAENCKEI